LSITDVATFLVSLVFVDSSVYAAGTVDQMLNGKEFNRATRTFVLAYEALSVSWLSAFLVGVMWY
jgi:hypothetical protein